MLRLLTLLFVSGAVVDGGFIVRVLLSSYSVPDGRTLNGNGCDQTDRFGRNCDIILKMCIEDKNRLTQGYNCDGGYKSLGIVSQDQNTLTFQPNSFYGDWPNPYTFFSDSPTYNGVRIKVQAYDANFGVLPDSLIDQFYFDVVQSVNNKYIKKIFSHPRKNPGGTPLQPTILTLSTEAQCTGGNCVATTPKPTPPPTTQPTCNLKSVTLDVMESIDASANMGSSNYAAAQSFWTSFSKMVNIGSNNGQTQMSVGYYSSTQQCNSYYLFYNQNGAGIANNIKSWKYQGGNSADITQATSLEKIVLGGRGFRRNAKHMFVLTGPGINTGSSSQAIANAKAIKAAGVPIYAICYGTKSCNVNFLKQLTTQDKILVLYSQSDFQRKALPWLSTKICQLINS